MRRYSVPLSIGLALAVLAVALYAGPLDPPAGPITPTYKTLSEVEPRIAINTANTPGDADSLFKITQPGSYYLTGNITGVSAKSGVEIAAGGVTLDLRGFDLVGVSGALNGVNVSASITNVAVVNGSLRNWSSGVFASLATNSRLTDLRVSGSTGIGMRAGSNSVVANCSAESNTGVGISTSPGCTITNCSAQSNTGSGINASSGCTITDCSAQFNTLDGIRVISGCTITNCSAQNNTSSGINTGSGCTITNCTVVANTSSGISTSGGCTITNCSAVSNTLDGIRVTNDSLVRSNTCASNGFGAGDGAGIHATGSDNRIEGNNCTQADRGIEVGFAGNIIVRNTCSGNGINWVFAANNVFGPIVDRTAPASAAVSGNSAASSLGSTDANANFSY